MLVGLELDGWRNEPVGTSHTIVIAVAYVSAWIQGIVGILSSRTPSDFVSIVVIDSPKWELLLAESEGMRQQYSRTTDNRIRSCRSALSIGSNGSDSVAVVGQRSRSIGERSLLEIIVKGLSIGTNYAVAEVLDVNPTTIDARSGRCPGYGDLVIGTIIGSSREFSHCHRSIVSDKGADSLAVARTCLVEALYAIAVETAFRNFVHHTQMFARSHSGKGFDDLAVAINNHRFDADERTTASEGGRRVVPLDSSLQGTILARSNSEVSNLAGSRSLSHLERNVKTFELSSKLVAFNQLGSTGSDIDLQEHGITCARIRIGVHIEVPLSTILIVEEVIVRILQGSSGIAGYFADVAQLGNEVADTGIGIDLIDLAPIAYAVDITVIGDGKRLQGVVERGHLVRIGHIKDKETFILDVARFQINRNEAVAAIESIEGVHLLVGITPCHTSEHRARTCTTIVSDERYVARFGVE